MREHGRHDSPARLLGRADPALKVCQPSSVARRRVDHDVFPAPFAQDVAVGVRRRRQRLRLEGNALDPGSELDQVLSGRRIGCKRVSNCLHISFMFRKPSGQVTQESDLRRWYSHITNLPGGESVDWS